MPVVCDEQHKNTRKRFKSTSQLTLVGINQALQASSEGAFDNFVQVLSGILGFLKRSNINNQTHNYGPITRPIIYDSRLLWGGLYC